MSEASGVIAERPRCHSCGTFMELRGKTGYSTPEQKFCGIWYDHPQMQGGRVSFGHTSCILLPSAALIQQELEMTGPRTDALFEVAA